MEPTTSNNKLNARKFIYLLLIIGFVTAVAQPFQKKPQGVKATGSTKAKPAANNKTLEESKQAFLKAYTVFMSPRCMNCHPTGDVPLQGDDSHLHAQGVQRGKEGKGIFALKCKNCHQDANLAGANMPPGTPDWSMPPMKHRMVFQGMSPKQLATHFKDTAFTGFKSLNDMIHHVEHEPLVLNSFIPLEGRAKIPMSHEEFVKVVKEWIAKGAVVPDK